MDKWMDVFLSELRVFFKDDDCDDRHLDRCRRSAPARRATPRSTPQPPIGCCGSHGSGGKQRNQSLCLECLSGIEYVCVYVSSCPRPDYEH